MANSIYAKSIKKMVDGTGLAWSGALWKVVLVDATYTVDLTTHAFLSDITSGKRVATSAALTNVTVRDDAVLDADDAAFTAVSGATAPFAVIYKDTAGADTLKELLVYFDTLSGLPITPNGTNVTLTWANDADRISRL